jgi:imidazolonepropionase
MSERLLVRGARQLLTLRGPQGPRRGPALKDLGIVVDGAVLIHEGKVQAVGPASRVENLADARKAREIDAAGMVVMPGFVDSHTHLVFAASRLADYEMRIEGRSYAEIAAAGGGILSSVQAVRASSSYKLEERARTAMAGMARHGTTTVEVKSGYGLNTKTEMKMLRVAGAMDGKPLDVVPTLLGAHVVPPEFAGRPDDYIENLCVDCIPRVARRKLARFADVYCDENAFSVEQSRRYLLAARRAGLGLKLHASQFANLGGVQLGVELGAVSVDHLENVGPAEVLALAGSETIATLLPGSVFHLASRRYAPARRLIYGGAAVALATDFNPGTSPTYSMQMILSLACTEMGMTPAESIAAATINAAHALRTSATVGSLEAGKQADMILLKLADYRELPYYFGVNHVAATIKQGKVIYQEKEADSI